MAGGSVGRDVVVDLSQGFRWTAPDWSRRTVWAGASVTWADVTEAARPFGLRLPPDPSSGGFATSGGMAATNAAGPAAARRRPLPEDSQELGGLCPGPLCRIGR